MFETQSILQRRVWIEDIVRTDTHLVAARLLIETMENGELISDVTVALAVGADPDAPVQAVKRAVLENAVAELRELAALTLDEFEVLLGWTRPEGGSAGSGTSRK